MLQMVWLKFAGVRSDETCTNPILGKQIDWRATAPRSPAPISATC
jgi:hypothetical protein